MGIKCLTYLRPKNVKKSRPFEKLLFNEKINKYAKFSHIFTHIALSVTHANLQHRYLDSHK